MLLAGDAEVFRPDRVGRSGGRQGFIQCPPYSAASSALDSTNSSNVTASLSDTNNPVDENLLPKRLRPSAVDSVDMVQQELLELLEGAGVEVEARELARLAKLTDSLGQIQRPEFLAFAKVTYFNFIFDGFTDCLEVGGGEAAGGRGARPGGGQGRAGFQVKIDQSHYPSFHRWSEVLRSQPAHFPSIAEQHHTNILLLRLYETISGD